MTNAGYAIQSRTTPYIKPHKQQQQQHQQKEQTHREREIDQNLSATTNLLQIRNANHHDELETNAQVNDARACYWNGSTEKKRLKIKCAWRIMGTITTTCRN